MALRRAVLVLSLAAAVSAALSLAISASFGQEPVPADEPSLGVEWAYRPVDLPALVGETPAIVVAEVEAVRAGEPAVIAPAEAGEDAFVVPTRRIDLHVTQAIDGQTPADFTLFQLGGEGIHPEGDPGYTVGERYLLFVEPRRSDDGQTLNPDGTWIPVAPDGRLEKVAGVLDAELPGPVATALDGATITEAKAEIAAAEAGSP